MLTKDVRPEHLLVVNGDDRSLQHKYQRLWAASESGLRRGDYKPDSIPLHGDPRWGLSLVLRVDGSVRDLLCTELEVLALLRRAPHLVYSVDHLHSTVRSLEGFQDEVPASQIEHYAAQLRRVAYGLDPIEIEYVGLSGSADGIFACGYPSESLATLRQRLLEDQLPLGALGVEPAYATMIRDTAHVSMMIYRPPLLPETAIANYVSSCSDRYFGTIAVTSLSLVRYNPTPESVCLTELATIPL